MEPENKVLITIFAGFVLVVLAIFFLQYTKSFKIGNINISQSAKEQAQSAQVKPGKNCPNIPNLPDNSEKTVTKIIDGDTVIIEGGYPVRVLGIDADEKERPCYQAAKNYLEQTVLGKKVRLEKGESDLDIYCRYLRFVFLGDENISVDLAKNGLAVARFYPDNVKYRQEVIQAEQYAKTNGIGCKWQEK